MLSELPYYIPFLFIVTTLATLAIFHRAISNSSWGTGSRPTVVLVLMLCWLALQAILAYSGFYTNTSAFPPRLAVGLLAPTLLIASLFLRYRGKLFMISLSLKALTYIHVVRVPVELLLLALYLHNAVPQLMTFEGRNFDIIAGLSAPVIAYLGLTRRKMSYQGLLVWHCVSLALLLNIVTIAALSAPFPFQQFGLDQPNIAVLYFPFVWLPSFIVPVILFSHLVSIWQLARLSRRTPRNYTSQRHSPETPPF